MTVPRPLQLVRWTHDQARAMTMIARQGADRLLVPVGGAQPDVRAMPWNIRMRPLCSKRIAWAPSRADQSENTGHDAYRLIGFAWNGIRLWVRVSSRLCGDWLALRMPDLDLGTLPPGFIDAAWDAMIQDVLTTLGAARIFPGMQVLVDELPDRQATYPYAWTLSIRTSDTLRTIRAELAVDDAGLQRLGDLLGKMPAPHNGDMAEFLDALSILVVARAGETTLEAAALRGLEPGDVVLLDRCMTSLDGDAWLATPDGQGVRVRACEPGVSRYVVTQEWSSLLMNDYPPPERDRAPDEDHYPPMGGGYLSNENGSMSQENDPPPQHDGYLPAQSDYAPEQHRYAPEHNDDTPHQNRYVPEHHDDAPGQNRYSPGQNAYLPRSGISEPGLDGAPVADPTARPATRRDGPDVDRIPVRLVFDLGEHKMTLGELRRLKPGEFFDLQRPIDAGPVHIRANGTLIGTAELVDIDGRIGARVLTLVPGRDSWD